MIDHPGIEQPREIEDDTRGAKRPLVSVVMPLYRENPFYKQAITSILSQTCTSLELIVICDEPTTETRRELERLESEDKRVVVRFNTPGIGLVPSRNMGIWLARGTYINPMDSDDISYLERLQRQITFLEDHPEIGLLGTGVEYIDARGALVRHVDTIVNLKALKWVFFFENPFCQSSVVIRRRVLDQAGWYDESRPLGEDYDLWIRIARISTVRVLPDVLLQYRVHETNISTEMRPALDDESSDLNAALVRQYFKFFSNEDIASFRYLFLRREVPSKRAVTRLRRLIRLMFNEFVERERPSKQEMTEIRRHIGFQYLVLAYLSRKAAPLQAMNMVYSGFRYRRSLPCDIVRLILRRVNG